MPLAAECAAMIVCGATHRGEAFNPLHKVGYLPAIQWQIRAFKDAGLPMVLLVLCGPRNRAVEKLVTRLGVVLIYTQVTETDMFSGVKRGLTYLEDQYGWVMITPPDIPLFSQNTVRQLLKTDAAVANPVCQGKSGHPLLLARDCFKQIEAYQGGGGLRKALDLLSQPRAYIEVSDRGIILDVEDENGSLMLQRLNRQQLHPEVQLTLATGLVMMNPQSRQLLSLIDWTGSVRTASTQMGMSYSKAWQLLQQAEEAYGQKLVDRQRGGSSGGRASLLPAAKNLLRRYDLLEEKLREAGQELFNQIFPEGWEQGAPQPTQSDLSVTNTQPAESVETGQA
ncbi:NTP transferase domain-containing protein [Oscillospiraceae bacterium HV4-5-C5C]|nr:NTP transferase domain-containing protein [Oscillospiraceae bacterium HV4-5-C5C]